MAITAIPSLHLKPVAYKTSKVYAKLPEGSAGNFTFTRNDANASRTNKEGLVEFVGANICRLDYPLVNGVVQSCPEILIEPTRENLFVRSQEFDNASWVKQTCSIIANATVSPDGTQSADKMVTNVTTSVGIYQIPVYNINTNHVISVFAKYAGISRFELSWNGQGVTIFDLLNGTVVSGSGGIINYGNGWYRCYTITQRTTTAQAVLIRFEYSNGETPNGNLGIYLWDAGIVEGEFITKNIKTVSTTITRLSEILNNGGDSTTFNNTEGVLYLETSALGLDSLYNVVSISDGTSDNIVSIFYTATTKAINVVVKKSGVDVYSYSVNTISYPPLEFHKIALKYKSEDFALWIDGSEINTSSANITALTGLNRLHFTDYNGSLSPFYSRIRDVKYYNTLLSDADLEELTT